MSFDVVYAFKSLSVAYVSSILAVNPSKEPILAFWVVFIADIDDVYELKLDFN